MVPEAMKDRALLKNFKPSDVALETNFEVILKKLANVIAPPHICQIVTYQKARGHLVT